MDILFLLVPLSVLLALAILAILAWAVWSGQFEELDSEGVRIILAAPDEILPIGDASLMQINTTAVAKRDT